MPPKDTGTRLLERVARFCFVLLIVSLPGAIAPMSISAGLCGVVTVALWLRSRIRPESTPVAWPAVAWLLALAMSAAFAIDSAESWPRVTKGLFPALVSLAAFHGSNRRYGVRVVSLLLLSSAVLAAIGVVSFIAQGASIAFRARGWTGHYMTFAGQLQIMVSLAFGLALTSRTPGRRWLAGATALVGSVALACTYTRSAWLGLAGSLAVIMALARWRWLPALAGAFVILYLVMPGDLRRRFDSSFDSRHASNVERTHMWQAGWTMFRERPWTGVGLQDLRAIYPRYSAPEAREVPGHLHSNVVQVAATMGVLGLVAFAALYASLFAAAGVALRTALAQDDVAGGLKVGVIGGLVGFLVAGGFEWNFGDEELLYPLYVLVGLAWAARSWPREVQQAQRP